MDNCNCKCNLPSTDALKEAKTPEEEYLESGSLFQDPFGFVTDVELDWSEDINNLFARLGIEVLEVEDGKSVGCPQCFTALPDGGCWCDDPDDPDADADLDKLLGYVDELESALEESYAIVSRLEDELTVANDSRNVLFKDIDNRLSRIRELQAEKRELEKQIELTSYYWNRAQSQNAYLIAERDNLLGTLNQQAEEIARLSNVNEQLRLDLRGLSQKYDVSDRS